MKATGIVRRIDDLGRVVIPKEIRRTLRLREGTPLEIFTDREGEIILKKILAYDGAHLICRAVCRGHGTVHRPFRMHHGQGPGHSCGRRGQKDLLQRNISRQLEQAINERSTVIAAREDKAFIQLVDEELEGISAQVVAPIICEGDAIGAVALMSREPGPSSGTPR